MAKGSRAAAILFLAVSLAAGGEELFVSPAGRDGWSGRLAAPNAAGTDGPFATVERARDEVAAVRERAGGAIPEGISVTLRGGTYELARPLRIGIEHAGSAEHAVTYRGFPGERAVLSGGRTIGGFRPTSVRGRSAVAAMIPEVASGSWRFTELFVNGTRAPRTRLPRDGYYTIAEIPGVTGDTPWNVGQDGFRFAPGDLRSWRNLADVEVVVLHFWVESRSPLAEVDEGGRIARLARRSTFRLTDDFTSRGARYYVENVAEALDEPGEWYLDRPTGTLTYLLRPGEDPRTLTVVAPALESLVSVEGNPVDGTLVENVRFEGLVFSHAETAAPSSFQAAVDVPAAIALSWASGCVVERCEVSAVGTYAVEVGYGCRDIAIRGCLLTDLGAGGLKVGRGSRHTVIEDNEISDGGKRYRSAVGVWIGDSGSNVVAHNRIHDLDYTGISVGWVWGYGLSWARDNVIEANDIHDIGRNVLSDLAGIYTLGVSPGTVIRGNLIRSCSSWSYGGWGIYLDEGSSFITVEGNVVSGTKTGGFHQHYGQDNQVRNNLFAYGAEQQIQRTRAEAHISFTFERNIVLYRSGTLLAGAWGDDNFVVRDNLYWDERWGSGVRARAGAIVFAGATLRQWQRRGHDTKSVLRDPLLADPGRGDYRPAVGSPALALGFRTIDLSGVGPRSPPGIGARASGGH